MQTRYLVTYDISDDDRRTLVFKTLRGYGDHIQYSVFRCDLSEMQKVALVAALHPLINHSEDQILVIDLGPVDGRGADCIVPLGRRYLSPERTVIVI